MVRKLDLGFKNEGLGKALSNLVAYPFVMDDVQCGSFEGWIQSIKIEDIERQSEMAKLSGFKAWKAGQDWNGWWEHQTLWWRGTPYTRSSKKYLNLIERAYDTCFDQNSDFREALLMTGADILTHYIGKHDPMLTTLTETEYIYNMYRLRAKAQQHELEG